MSKKNEQNINLQRHLQDVEKLEEILERNLELLMLDGDISKVLKDEERGYKQFQRSRKECLNEKR